MAMSGDKSKRSLDNQILELLEHNARISNDRIASLLGVETDRVRDAIERMEREKVILGYSVRSVSELCYQDEIAAIEKQYPGQFTFVPFVTREQLAGAINQRIPASIEDGSLEKRTGIEINSADSHVMMCGNSAMIGSVMECLVKRGMRKHLRREPGHITTEKYH